MRRRPVSFLAVVFMAPVLVTYGRSCSERLYVRPYYARVYARFTMTPNVVANGQRVDFNALSSESNTEYDTFSYEWDFGDGHGFVPGRAIEGRRFWVGAQESRTIRLRISDAFGAPPSEAADVLLINPATSITQPNSPPGGVTSPPQQNAVTATFTVSPNPATVNQPVTFDASGSSSPYGPITDYAWTFGDGDPMNMSGPSPTIQRTYTVCKQTRVWLRVTDSTGAREATYQDFYIQGCPPGRPAMSAAARPPRGSQAFSAAITNAQMIRSGSVTKHGSTTTRTGIVVAGRLDGRLPGGGRLSRFTKARWIGDFKVTVDRARKRSTVNAIAVARFPSRGAGTLCLRLAAAQADGKVLTGSFAVIGGTGAAGRLAGGGRFSYARGADGIARLAGAVRAASGRPRPLPAACRGLSTTAR